MNKYAERRIFRKSVWQMTKDGLVLIPRECESFIYRGPVAEAVAFLYTPPFGVPGDLSRPGGVLDVETQALNSSLPFSNFGLPGKMVSGLFVPITTTADPVYGFLVRPYPAQGANASDPLGTAVPITSGPCSVMRKGYMNVFVQLQTVAAAFGLGVYIRVAAPSGNQIVGGIESGTTANNYLLTGAQFMGPADASGNAEISFAGVNI